MRNYILSIYLIKGAERKIKEQEISLKKNGKREREREEEKDDWKRVKKDWCLSHYQQYYLFKQFIHDVNRVCLPIYHDMLDQIFKLFPAVTNNSEVNTSIFRIISSVLQLNSSCCARKSYIFKLFPELANKLCGYILTICLTILFYLKVG